MKTILAGLFLFSNFALADGGGDGMTQPGDYYNDDYKCSLPQDKTLYVKAKAYHGVSVSATVYDSRANKVHTIPLEAKFAYEAHEAGVYSVEPLQGSTLAFIEINFKARQAKVLDANNLVISKCRYMDIPADTPVFN